jgi:hypothetical protein
MDLQLVVRLFGIAVLDVIILYVAYLFYDKNPTISLVSLIVGVVITLSYVLSTLYFKNKTFDAQTKETEAKASGN